MLLKNTLFLFSAFLLFKGVNGQDCNFTAHAGNDTIICEGSNLHLHGTIGGGAISPAIYGLLGDAVNVPIALMAVAGMCLLTLPLVGRVAAGHPILAQEHIDQTYVLEASLFPRKPDYLLKVKGMSMRDIGILVGTARVLVHRNAY